MRPSTALPLLLTLAACAAPRPDAAAGSAEAAEAIGAAWRAHVEAALRDDLAGVVAMYADDVVYLVGDQHLTGIAAVEAMEAATLAEMELVGAVHTTLALRVFDGVAYEVGTIVGPVRAAGSEEATVVHFPFTAQWVRGADGAWRLRCLVGPP